MINTLLFAATLLATAWPARADSPDQRKSPGTIPPDFEERWYVVMMENPGTNNYTQCGYMHATMRTIDDIVKTHMKTKIEIRRGPASVQILQDQSYRESAGGKPLGFKFTTSMGKDPETLTGEVKGEKVSIVAEQYGQVKERGDHPFDSEIRFPWGQALLQRKKGLEEGTTYVLKSYEPAFSKDAPLEVHCKVMGRSMQEVLGKKQELSQIKSSMKLSGISVPGAPEGAIPGAMDIESDTWVDDEFTPVITTMNIGFMKMKMYETTKDDAMKRGAPPEMFFETFVKTDAEVGIGAKEVTLRLRLKKDAPGALPDLPVTPMQSVKRISDREMIVTIRRNDWKKAHKAGEIEKESAALEPYLAASHVCDARDSKIRRIARRAVRGKKSPADKADALRRLVTEYITDKNMDVGFATASDVVRNRCGDCTEHGVLLAAVCRASGIPARGVSGIIEVPSGYIHEKDGNAFGYHMWTQAYIGGEWIDIDAAMRQTDCEPNRVALTIMPLGDEGLVNTVAAMIPIIGRLEIEVVDVKR
ncbi:MAG: transglutaminase domain-containing protein [Planctomycetes bacterium]|nr:transglutaminase domain-containing protein [Planctomycetota bacterium]